MGILVFSLLIGLILIFYGGYLFGHSRKDKQITEINFNNLTKYEKEKNNKIDEINTLKKEKELLENDIKHKKENYNQLLDSEKQSIDNIVKEYKEKKFIIADREYLSKLQILNKEFEEEKEAQKKLITSLKSEFSSQKEIIKNNIEQLEEELQNLKDKHKAAIEEQLRQEKILQEQEFYKIQLSDLDIDDINELTRLIPKLNNKDVLSKLIFETYYKKPMGEMFFRIAGASKPSGIYKITNLKNNKIYIGKSVEIVPRRWTEHIKSSLGIGTISHAKIHDAIKEFGINNFTFEILEECSKEKLTEREKYWISFYESDVYGYNIKKG